MYVTIENVSKTIKGKQVLCEVNAGFERGRIYGVVGPNGSGKSTLARLIAGLTAPDGGEVTLLGQRVYAAGPNADAYRAARHGIGMVFQNPEDQLVTTVLEDDVAFGPENLGVPTDEIWKRVEDSLKSVGMISYRHHSPNKLSGGQKQRISIARVFLKNPPILILDEATSALDNATEMLIQQSLEELGRGRTSIIVAHRLSTIKNADEIIVLTSEGIAERGSHEELIKAGGMYAELYQYQFRD